MPVSKIKRKVKKGGINHLKKAFKSDDIYQEIRTELQLSQYRAFDEIITFFDPENTSSKLMILSGSAGTGKTYLSGKVTEYLNKLYFCNVLLCAPTNKAVKVLKNTQTNVNAVTFMTIHSALGLTESIDDEGNEIFINQKKDQVKIHNYDFIIVDESSMIDAWTFAQILEETKDHFIKVLFVGDKYQTPPVKSMESFVFTDNVKESYDIKEAELTAIIRQHHANPIIKIANHIKNDLGNPRVISDIVSMPEYQNLSQVVFVKKDKNELINLLKTYFNDDRFDADPDYCKVLAWTNDRVNKFNNLIRKLKYGNDVEQLVVNEKIIFDRPFMIHRRMAFSANEEVTIVGLEPDGVLNLFDRDFHFYNAKVCREGSSIHERLILPILKKESYENYISVKKYLKSQAELYPKGSPEFKGWYATWYTFRDKFAAIKYNYAITVHKSQGSTYKHAIVANYDINNNVSVVERNRIKYTAVTRPKDKLYIIV